MNLSDDNLYHYVFHYNPFREEWAVVHRNYYTAYWNDPEAPVLRHKDIEVLKQLVRDLPLDLFSSTHEKNSETQKDPEA